MRKLLIVLAVVLTSCTGQVDLGRIMQQLPAAIAPEGTSTQRRPPPRSNR